MAAHTNHTSLFRYQAWVGMPCNTVGEVTNKRMLIPHTKAQQTGHKELHLLLDIPLLETASGIK
jgi:hypothetical protein